MAHSAPYVPHPAESERLAPASRRQDPWHLTCDVVQQNAGYGLTGTGEAAGEPVGVDAAQSVEPVVDEPVDDVSDVPDFNEDDIVMIPIEIFDFLDDDDDEVNS